MSVSHAENMRSKPAAADQVHRKPSGGGGLWHAYQQAHRYLRHTLNSPLTLRMLGCNLLAMNLLMVWVAFVAYPNPQSVDQHRQALVGNARVMANTIEAKLEGGGLSDMADLPTDTLLQVVEDSPLSGISLFRLFDASSQPVHFAGRVQMSSQRIAEAKDLHEVQALEAMTRQNRFAFSKEHLSSSTSFDQNWRQFAAQSIKHMSVVTHLMKTDRSTTIFVTAPIILYEAPVGAVGVFSDYAHPGMIKMPPFRQSFWMFLFASLVSVVASLALASTISNPIARLASAVELGRDRTLQKSEPPRLRIPDLTKRNDEIGRLSGALRGMVAALYDRIEANEQFAADVAHEVKNPLSSLNSAVTALRITGDSDHQDTLLSVIEHDVRRLDRLITDISSASRLDSDLVKEARQPFCLQSMIEDLHAYYSPKLDKTGVLISLDMPDFPVVIHGLEARLAQVFVNLIENAISFCEGGDAIRIWVRQRNTRVLIVFEDTGPGISEDSLEKIFQRFYSQRPDHDFGNNSGLGLSISKQIVEAHGGVMWAENIRPTDADALSDPLGARFVVGLPV